MKKIFKYLLIALAISATTPLSISARTTAKESEPIVIQVKNQDGNLVNYSITEETTEIPVYSVKVDSKDRSVVNLATLYVNLNYDTNILTFSFIPSSPAIAVATRGFTGSVYTSYFGGYTGYYNYRNTLRGTAMCKRYGRASFSGTYTVIGYAPVQYTKVYQF